MSRFLLQTAQRWWMQARRVEVIEVIQTQGSVPRERGARMLVCEDEVVGTIGGGHLEWQALQRARQRLQGPQAADEEQRVALGPSLGQCCGGALTLRTFALNEKTLAQWPITAPRFRLDLYGAGHVGRAVVRALQDIDAQVRWLDTREEALSLSTVATLHDPLRALWLETVWSDSLVDEVVDAPAGSFYLVMTHSHDLDLALSERILRRGDHGFFGLIGSATKRARFEKRLRDRGLEESRLATLTCPIGLPDIQGKEPAVIAASVVAQLLSRSTPPESH